MDSRGDSGLVLVVDSESRRRRKIDLAIRACTDARLESHPTLARAFPGLCMPGTPLLTPEIRLAICPWDHGGESLLLERIALGGRTAVLLVLCETVTPMRIALAQRAGNAHLLSSDPLDFSALRNRILLSLDGVSALRERSPRRGAALGRMLARKPALGRRLAMN